MALKVIRSGSARIAVEEAGIGPAVVLLHPGVADRRCWAATTAALAPHYRVISYDRRGFGATEYDPEPNSPAVDLAALLDALEIERAALVGNSRGGRVAIDFTLALPDRVAALVLIGSAVRGAPDPTVPPDVQLLAERIDDCEAAGDRDGQNAAEARLWLDGPSRPEGAVGGPARELFLEMNARALAAADPGPEFEPHDGGAWNRLPEIRVPVLSVVGVHDLPHLVQRAHHLAQSVADGHLVTLPNSAHLPQLDDPQTLDAVLIEFLERVYPGL